MIDQFVVAPELQKFLSGVDSKALVNILWDIPFDGSADLLPSNPTAARRSLMFSRGGYSVDATPNPIEFNCYLKNLDGSSEMAVTTPRGF